MKNWCEQMQQLKIYFDNASSTPLNADVLKTYERLLNQHYVNADALYEEGSLVNEMLEKSRKAIAAFFSVLPQSILFTSGATESNNLAIKGVAFAYPHKKHLITSEIEHPSVLEAMKQLEEYFGYRLTILPVNQEGQVCPNTLEKALCEDTLLVSIMYVNNEIGSINPIDKLADIVKKNSHAFFHVDMVQALGKCPIDLSKVDMASFSAHKINGLKGSGILFKKPHVKLLPLLSGGQQEYYYRAGTSNYCVHMLFYKTLRLFNENYDKAYITDLTLYCMHQLRKIDVIKVVTPSENIGGIVNFIVKGIYSEILQNAFNKQQIMVGARSTCSTKSKQPSYVLKALGYSDEEALSSIRVSFGMQNTKEEVDRFIQCLKENILKYANV